MIDAVDICKVYRIHGGEKVVLRDVNLRIMPGEKIGVMGRNGAGKSTLVRILSGAEWPTSGTVSRKMTVSWPLAFGGAFQTALTGLDNLRFICRIYGVDPAGTVDFVDDFSELGRYLREPVRSYSAGMRARLAFAISMVVDFDCFLIDEVIAVGDARFHEKCRHELFVKRADRAMIIISHDAGYVREHCTKAGVLDNGELRMFADVATAEDQYYAATC